MSEHFIPAASDDTLERVLRVSAGAREHHTIWWRPGYYQCGDDLAMRLMVSCSDVFAWGCADAEAISAETVALLEQSYADVRQVLAEAGADDWDGTEWAYLYCARVRGERPQGAVYAHLHSATWPLFDAAGPARETGFGNPKPHPSERTEPQRTGAEAKNRRRDYDLALPAFGRPLAERPASLGTIRRALERTEFDYTEALRWTVDADGNLRLFAITFGQVPEDEWSWDAAEVTDENVDLLIRLFDEDETPGQAYSADPFEVTAAFIREQVTVPV